MGEPLPYTARLEIASSIKNLTADYTDSCGQPIQLPVGAHIEEALIDGAKRTYKTVLYETDQRSGLQPDLVLVIDLLGWSFELDKDALYDRAPAILQLNAIARVHNAEGTVIRETEIQVARRERLRLEQLARNCNYLITPFIRDTAVEVASRILLDSRLASQGRKNPPVATQMPASAGESTVRAGAAPSTSSTLKFKAMLFDENGDLVLEGGEHVRIRVDMINTGTTPIQNASASLTGAPFILGQFPATTLSVPPLQPGETKSLEFVATVPPAAQAQRAEIHVVVVESDGATAAPPQTLSLTIEPGGIGTDEVDQIPFPTTGFRRPHTYLISIGVGAYRDPQLQPRKYAAVDAKVVAGYFRALGGVPPSNIRLLQDWKAFRYEIDEALHDWLPSAAGKEAVVIIYFSGQALVDQTGNVFLVSHESSTTIQSLLYPLSDMDAALSRINAKQVLFLFDVKVSKLPGEAGTKPVVPNWTPGGAHMYRMVGGDGFTKGVEDDKHRHGLFTYYLLRGLRGDADTNRDRAVTLGELAGYARQKVAWAAKSQFSVEQRPQILPGLKPGDKASGLVLSRLAALTAQ